METAVGVIDSASASSPRERQSRKRPNMNQKTEPYERFDTEKLLLDQENPRIVELGLPADAKQDDITKALWEKMAVAEVAMSIAWNGYFAHEPLFVEKDKKGQMIVIEGNRRLAAVKLLLDKSLREKVGATDLPDIDTIDRK